MYTELLYNQWHAYMSSHTIEKVQLPLTLSSHHFYEEENEQQNDSNKVHFIFNNQFKSLISDPTEQLLSVYKHKECSSRCFYWTPIVYSLDNSLNEKNVCGIECLNDDTPHYLQLVSLIKMAVEFLDRIGQSADNYIIDIGNVNILNALLKDIGIDKALKRQIQIAIDNKNFRKIKSINATKNDSAIWKNFLLLNGSLKEIEDTFDSRLYTNKKIIETSLSECQLIEKHLNERENLDIRFDFTFTNRCSYYDDYIFKIYDKTSQKIICQGGCYDQFSKKYGFSSGSGMSFDIENLI